MQAVDRAKRARSPNRAAGAASALHARIGNRALGRRLAAAREVEAARAIRESGASRPLAPAVRARMESGFGEDFGAVRVHRGPEAAAAARARRARAFTAGSHVVLGAGGHATESAKGRRLLAHELAHVVQQSRGGSSAGAAEGRTLEGAAERAAAALAAGRGPVRVEGASAVAVMRQPEPGAEGEREEPAAEEKPPETTPKAEEAPAAGESVPPIRRSYEVGELLAHPVFGKPDPSHLIHKIWPGHTLRDLWSDLIAQNLTREQRVEFRLRGTESGALWAWSFAPFHIRGLGGREAKAGDFGDYLSTVAAYAKALQPLTPSSDLYLDTAGRILGVNLEKGYLESELFEQRLEENASRLVALGLGAQIVWSIVQANKEPAAPGELEEAEWRRHAGLILGLSDPLLKKYTTAPGLLNVAPLSIPTHPAFAFRPWAGGAPPSGLSIEHQVTPGPEPGYSAKYSALLNLRKLSLLGSGSELSASDLDDLRKERGWQTSLWGSFDVAQPTEKAAAGGAVPTAALRGGSLFGSAGHLIHAEAGARWSGEGSRELSSLFFTGGWGYSGKKDEFTPRMGFKSTFLRWEEGDPLARLGGGGEAGWALQATPFAGYDLELTGGHRLGLGAFTSLVIGSRETLGLAALRGDLSYAYLGEQPNGLPEFEARISYSASRLDWHDPDSPLLHGLELRFREGPFFQSGRVMTGAQEISAERAAQLASDDPTKAQKATAILLVSGYHFNYF